MGQNNVDWLTVSPLSGIGNGVITITASTMEELTARTATLTAYNTGQLLSSTTIINQSYASNAYDYLTFDILTGGTIVWNSSVYPTRVISYSKNNGSWEDTSGSETTINVDAGDKIRFKCSTYYGFSGSHFSGTAYFNVYGNLLSLIYGDDFYNKTALKVAGSEDTNWNNFQRLFGGNFYYEPSILIYRGARVVSAENLVFPLIISGTKSAFDSMFEACVDLTTPPKQLPAKNITYGCYSNMFQGCTGLTSSPELPATTISGGCYDNMFDYCINLNNIKCLATDFGLGDNTTNWVRNVSQTGTFYKKSGSIWTTGNDGIPTGWTVVDV